MLVALADTHGTRRPRLTDHLRDVLERAEVVLHAGDLTTPAVLDSFESFGGLRAVYGNSDDSEVCERLPETSSLEWAGTRFVLTHGHRRGWTSLSMLARQERGDVVVVGHTHRPSVGERGEMAVVNPGSHADPRGHRATYAAFERTEGGVAGQCRTVNGKTLETVEL
jgi:phosphoesterase, MJ0936 family